MSLARLVAIVLVALPLLGCAGVPAPAQENRIERLTPQELARMLPPPEAKLSQADLVRLAHEGTPPEQIIARIKQTGSQYALNAAQLIALHEAGVSTQVLDYIQSAREQALLDRASEEINQRELRCAQQLKLEQQQCSAAYRDPWWPGWGYPYPPYPYGGFYWRR